MRSVRTAAASPAPRGDQQRNRDQLFNGNNSSTSSIPRVAPDLHAIGETSHLEPLGDNLELSPDGSPIMDRRLNGGARYSDSEGGQHETSRQSHEIAPPPPATQSFRSGPFSPPLMSIDTNSSINFSRPGTSQSLATSPSPIDSTSLSQAYTMSPSGISPAPSPSVYSTNTTIPRSNSQQISTHAPSLLPSPGIPTSPLPILPSPGLYDDSTPSGSVEDYRRRRSQAAEIENSSPGAHSRGHVTVEEESEVEEIGGAAAALAMIGDLGALEDEQASTLAPGFSPATPTGLESAIVLQEQQQQKDELQRTPRPEPTRIITQPLPTSTSNYDLGEDSTIHSDVRLTFALH